MKRCSILVLALVLTALICACTGSSVATIVEDGDTEALADGDTDTNEAMQDGDSEATDGDQAETEAEAEAEATPDGDAESEASDIEPESEQADNDTTEATCDADSCAISGTCYAAGALDPASPCRKCDIATSRTTWTNLAFAASCNDGNACTKNDQCDGQGACKGTLDAACQADGDAEYDPDIDPDEVEIGKSCPEQGIIVCIHHGVFACNAGVWRFTANCGDSNLVCWKSQCIDPNNTPDYPGCTFGEPRCNHDTVQACTKEGTWNDIGDCAASGYKCWLGSCVKNPPNHVVN